MMAPVSETPNAMTNSHLLVQDFDYREACSIEQALNWLAECGPAKTRLMAGGTDLLVMMKMERTHPEVLINIGKIPGLDEIILSPEGSLKIGALTTIHALGAHPIVRSHYPGLAEACMSFGSTQIEVMGTIGGNLCNGSPAADTAPILLALGAEVTLVSLNPGQKTGTDRRTLPLDEFFVGPGKTALHADEMMVEVTIPTPRPGSSCAFLKATRVVADLAKASLAISLTRTDDGQISACRVAMGSVAPKPLLLPGVADVLVGQVYTPELLAEAGVLAAESISPIDDVRSSAWYRRQIAKVLLQDAALLAWNRASQTILSQDVQHLSLNEGSIIQEKDSHSQTSKDERRYAAITSLKAGERQEIALKVNGREVKVWVAANELLLNVLREKLELTGAKYACGIGECGACTVQIDRKPALSCLVLAISTAGRHIVTVEGLQDPQTGALDPLQEAFIDHTAFQCGYCTPGILMTAKSLLEEEPAPGEDQIRHYLRGNHCRCTGYASIVRAVLDAAERR
jgi:xanthine dehydrogenase iron-sulfur cluster and FAD-binding subunit A